jgi:hypothetical protein
LKALAWANLALAFVLEMTALYILGCWGFQLNLPEMGKWYFALVTPFVFICAWSIWAAPKAKYRLKGWKLLAYKLVNFSLVAWALWAGGLPQWAMIFEAVVLVNLVLLWVWKRFEPS